MLLTTPPAGPIRRRPACIVSQSFSEDAMSTYPAKDKNENQSGIF
jgi:hypothetical protein